MAPAHRRAALALCCAALTVLSACRADEGAVILKNSNGLEAHILPTGACIQRLLVPDSSGELADVMMGFDDTASYENGTSVSGCLVGRYGGRITGGKISVDGVTYQLDTGKKGNDTLHGGGIGYNRVEWEVVEEHHQKEGGGGGGSWAILSYESPDGEQNFPGNVSLEVVYNLTDANELTIDITAISDAATPINVFSHPYFNLGGITADNDTILDHILTIYGDHYIATDPETGTPTGEVVPVEGTAADFTEPRTIGQRIGEYANTTKGYSHQYVLFGLGPDVNETMEGFTAVDNPQLAATLIHPSSGRGLDIYTTAPTLVLYTGNAFKGKFTTKGGVRPRQHAAVALEATMYPEAGNQPAFPSPILRPGDEFRNTVVWRFFNI